MAGVLLDTNVLSELTRKAPEPKVIDYVRGLTDAWLSVMTLHEIRFGLASLPEGRRKQELADAVRDLLERYGDRVLAVDPRASEWAADLRALAQSEGRVLHLADALIAGTAQAQGLTLATRNVGDFRGLGLGLVNPWD